MIKKRGRPSKADLAARTQQQLQERNSASVSIEHQVSALELGQNSEPVSLEPNVSRELEVDARRGESGSPLSKAPYVLSELGLRIERGSSDQESQDDPHQMDEINGCEQPRARSHPRSGGSVENLSISSVTNASTEVIRSILANHGIVIPLPHSALIEKLRQVLRTLSELLSLPLDADNLSELEVKELTSPSWMIQLRMKGFREEELMYLVSQLALGTDEDIRALRIRDIESLDLRVGSKNQLLAIREELINPEDGKHDHDDRCNVSATDSSIPRELLHESRLVQTSERDLINLSRGVLHQEVNRSDQQLMANTQSQNRTNDVSPVRINGAAEEASHSTLAYSIKLEQFRNNPF